MAAGMELPGAFCGGTRETFSGRREELLATGIWGGMLGVPDGGVALAPFESARPSDRSGAAVGANPKLTSLAPPHCATVSGRTTSGPWALGR